MGEDLEFEEKCILNKLFSIRKSMERKFIFM